MKTVRRRTKTGSRLLIALAGATVNVVRASLKGFHSEEKEAAVGGEGRVDVTFMLAPESK